jgi:hypothetical protein
MPPAALMTGMLCLFVAGRDLSSELHNLTTR